MHANVKELFYSRLLSTSLPLVNSEGATPSFLFAPTGNPLSLPYFSRSSSHVHGKTIAQCHVCCCNIKLPYKVAFAENFSERPREARAIHVLIIWIRVSEVTNVVYCFEDRTWDRYRAIGNENAVVQSLMLFVPADSKCCSFAFSLCFCCLLLSVGLSTTRSFGVSLGQASSKQLLSIRIASVSNSYLMQKLNSRSLTRMPGRQASNIVNRYVRFISSSNNVLKPRPTNISRAAAINEQIKPKSPSLSQMSFPCLEKLEQRTKNLEENLENGPEPAYAKITRESLEIYKSDEPLFLDYGGYLPQYEIAYETWGTLNNERSNAILLHTGLSASSHAHSTEKNPKRGWWEGFIGPGKYLDTDKYFVICTNVLGGCFGSTGPKSTDPLLGEPYATRFPILSVNDMVRAQHELVSKHFGISKLHASVGSSMGGMQCLAYAHEFTDEVNKIISISGCARSHPYSIAMRHCQRQVLMTDPNWNKGHYYGHLPPHTGMKLAREIATITYRSGPEWEQRFGVERADPSQKPALCPDFLVETYLDHAGEKWCLEFDPNSFLYISKAMDLFDLGERNRTKALKSRNQAENIYFGEVVSETDLEYKSSSSCGFVEPIKTKRSRRFTAEEAEQDLLKGLSKFAHKDVLVIGVESDILFPAWQQREIATMLSKGSKLKGGDGSNIKHVELSESDSFYGHDTFLLAMDHIGKPVRKFLSSN